MNSGIGCLWVSVGTCLRHLPPLPHDCPAHSRISASRKTKKTSAPKSAGRRPRTKEQSEAGMRNTRQRVKRLCGFLSASRSKSRIPNPSGPPPPSRAAATASSARRRKATQAVSTARRDVRTARRGSRIMPKKSTNRRELKNKKKLCGFHSRDREILSLDSRL